MTTSIFSTTIDQLSVGLPRHWGSLSLFPIYVHDGKAADVVAAVDAIRGGRLEISEADDATVPSLQARNSTGKKILLITGEMVFGGRQDRCVYDSMVIPPGHVDIPVAGLEQGRWAGEPQFEARTAVANRRVRHGSMAGRSGTSVDQDRVWDLVEESLAGSSVINPTRTLRPLIEAATRDVDQMVAMGPLPEQCGLALGSGDRVLGVELFGSHSLLMSYWEGLIRSFAVEHVDKYNGRPSLGQVLRFVRSGGRSLTPTGETELGVRSLGYSSKLAAMALVLNGGLIHMSVLAA